LIVKFGVAVVKFGDLDAKSGVSDGQQMIWC